MKNFLVSEDDVKKALNIENFRNISKDKIMEFVSLIPQMDKDVAMAIINQFPAYSESALNMIMQLNVMCDKLLASNKASQTDAIEAYKKVLETLRESILKDDITPEERDKITKQMIEVADKISAKDTENKKFLKDLFKTGAGVLSVVIVVGATILGVNMKGHDIPTLDDHTDNKKDSDYEV